MSVVWAGCSPDEKTVGKSGKAGSEEVSKFEVEVDVTVGSQLHEDITTILDIADMINAWVCDNFPAVSFHLWDAFERIGAEVKKYDGQKFRMNREILEKWNQKWGFPGLSKITGGELVWALERAAITPIVWQRDKIVSYMNEAGKTQTGKGLTANYVELLGELVTSHGGTYNQNLWKSSGIPEILARWSAELK